MAVSTPGNPEDLRRELRSLGYLEARVDRFLGAGAEGSASIPLALLALRVAAVAGPLLSLLQFGFAVVGEPTLIIDGPRAATRLFLLLVGEVHLVWLVALPIIAIARRVPTLGAKARIALGGALLFAAYPLLTWWHLRAALAESVDRRIGDCAALLLSGAFLLLVRRFLRAACGAERGRDRARQGGWRAQWITAGACLALTIVLPWHPFHSPSRPVSAFIATGSGERVVLIICDGLSRELHARAMERGWLAGLGERFRSGLLLPLDLGSGPITPPQVWTTALTGRGAEHHGVRRFARAQLPPAAASAPAAFAVALFPFLAPLRMTPLSAAERRVPNICEIVAAKGYRVLSINNWCSAPADSEAQWLVSDRAIRAAVLGSELPATERAEDVTPAAARPSFAARLRDFAALPAGERRAAADKLVLDLARDLEGAMGAPADLIVLTLSATDLLQLEGGSSARIEACVRALDRELAGYLANLAPDCIAILCGARGLGDGGADRTGFAWLSGNLFRDEAAAYLECAQIAPLILKILGFPRSVELAETPRGLLREEFLARTLPRYIETFGDRGREATPASAAAERLHMEALRTLGYLRDASGE